MPHPSRRSLLGGAASLAFLGGLGGRSLAATSNGRPPRNLVVFFAYGGWDPALAFDPKPDVEAVITPPGEVQSHHGHDVFVLDEAPEVGTFFRNHGAEVCMLRGVDMVSISHEICRRYALTGTAEARKPDLAAVVANTHGSDRPLPYLMVSSRAMPGPLAGVAGWLGRTNQLGAMLNPDIGLAPLPELGLPPEEAVDPVAAWLAGRHERAAGRFTGSASGTAMWEDYAAGQERIAALETHRDGFRGLPGLEQIDNQVDIALHTLANGLVRTVMLDSDANWDTHYDNALQQRYYAKLFGALDRLMAGLQSTPGLEEDTLLEETVVWVVSEMGRTPGLNDGAGKEHLPFTSTLMMGGGVKGGITLGATTDGLVGQRVNLATGALDDGGALVRPDNLVAGVLEGCGVSAEAWLPNVVPYMGPFVS